MILGLWAVHRATEVRAFAVVEFVAGRVLCASAEINTSVPAGLQLQLAPCGGLPVRTWPGITRVSRSRVNAFHYSYYGHTTIILMKLVEVIPEGEYMNVICMLLIPASVSGGWSPISIVKKMFKKIV